MRLVIQRVAQASVCVDGICVSEINSGLLILVGVENGDTEADADWLAQKTANLRIFPDESGIMNRSIIDFGGELLAVSQFTLMHQPGRVTGQVIYVRQMVTRRKAFTNIIVVN